MKVQFSFDQDYQVEHIKNEINQKSREITELQLEYFSIYDISNTLEQNKHEFKQLKTLKINSCIFNQLVLSFLVEQKSLIHLQLEGCWKISSQYFNEFINNASISNLKSLNLSGTFINDSFLNTLSQKDNQIEELNISFCHLLSDKGLTSIFNSSKFNKIKVLYLKCLKLTDTTLLSIADSKYLVGNLIKLSIYKCYNCSQKGIIKLLESPVVDKLQYFDASSSLFSNECLQTISKRDLKDLKILKFYECSQITDEGVKSLFESQLISRLHTLDLSWIQFEESTLQLLFNKKTVLKELSMPMVSKLSTQTLLNFFQQSQILNTVEILDLSYNQIDDSIIQYIIEKKKQANNIPLRDLLAYACINVKNKNLLKESASKQNITLCI